MNRAIIVCGPPASGKSTLAEEFIRVGYIHIERDKIRKEYFDLKDWRTWDWRLEVDVTDQWELDFSYLTGNGHDIVISDTLCKKKDRDRLCKRLTAKGYDVIVVILNPSLQVLLDRDRARGALSVGDEVITKMWRTINDKN